MAEDEEHYDHLLKLLMIGDSAVGKSCLLIRFAEDSFNSSFITTIGIDFKVRTINLDGQVIKLQIWDTAGQERFKTITTAYYRGAMGILLVYSIVDENSFANVRQWMKNIDDNATEGVDRILIGNKCDMEDERKISYEDGKALADEFNVKFFETSAKTPTNVEEAFLAIARDVKARVIDSAPADEGGDGNAQQSVDITATNKEKKGDCKC